MYNIHVIIDTSKGKENKMFSVKITWEDGEPTILSGLDYDKAMQWATYYNEAAKDQNVQGLVAVSIIG